jgi:hypothetical protein
MVAIEAREEELAAERRKAGIRPLGPARVLAQSWHTWATLAPSCAPCSTLGAVGPP